MVKAPLRSKRDKPQDALNEAVTERGVGEATRVDKFYDKARGS